ncbi:Hypothetical protein NTJ_05551 [Nesidiocoris tenuis]|uniref:Uncharacterized protein n=1 Tax=Nesidiocoris tenuis TaxID=355587 RepID=A0ABN7AKF6_9HEMI|nr:Hypothetical protein NTJ_05551 [Nesidiocoris tenuis]
MHLVYVIATFPSLYVQVPEWGGPRYVTDNGLACKSLGQRSCGKDELYRKSWAGIQPRTRKIGSSPSLNCTR